MPVKSRKPWRRSGSLLAAAALIAAACADQRASADERVMHLEPVVAIRDGGDSAVLLDLTRLVAGPRAGFIAFPVGGPRMIAFYDSAGRLEQLVGRKGKGPAEFEDITGLGVGPGDSIFVGDRLNGRMTVLAPGDHRFARSFPVTLADAGFRGTREGRLMSQSVTYKRGEGPTNHFPRRVSWDGTRVTPIATALGLDRPGRMAPADSGRVWVAESRAYTLRLFDGDSAIREIRRTPDWFPPDTTRAFRGIGKQTFVAAMGVGEEGMLWVLIRRPNPKWTGQVELKPGMPPSQFPPLDQVFEGVLEVLDPITGALIDSRVVSANMMDFIGPGRLYQIVDDDSTGARVLQVWRVGLKPPD